MSSTFKIKIDGCHFSASIDPLGKVNVISMDSRLPLFITTFGDIRLEKNHCKAHILGLKGRSVYNNTRLTVDHYLLLDAFGKESWPLQNMASGRLSVTGTMDLRTDFQNTGFFDIPRDLTMYLNGHQFHHLKTHGGITDLNILGTLRMVDGNRITFSGPVNNPNGRKEGALFIQTRAFENHDQIYLKQLTVHGEHVENHGAIVGDVGSIHTNRFLDNKKDGRITFRDTPIPSARYQSWAQNRNAKLEQDINHLPHHCKTYENWDAKMYTNCLSLGGRDGGRQGPHHLG